MLALAVARRRNIFEKQKGPQSHKVSKQIYTWVEIQLPFIHLLHHLLVSLELPTTYLQKLIHLQNIKCF